MVFKKFGLFLNTPRISSLEMCIRDSSKPVIYLFVINNLTCNVVIYKIIFSDKYLWHYYMQNKIACAIVSKDKTFSMNYYSCGRQKEIKKCLIFRYLDWHCLSLKSVFGCCCVLPAKNKQIISTQKSSNNSIN